MSKNMTWMATGVLGVAGVVAAVLATNPSGASPAPGEVIVVTPSPQVTEESVAGNDGGARPNEERTSGGQSGNGSGEGSSGGSGNGGSGNGSSGNGGSGNGSSGNGGSDNGSSGGDDAPETVSLASPVSAQSADTPPSAESPDDD